MSDLQKLPPKIQYLKLKRTTELNNKLRKELARERITASNACLKLIEYTSTTKDYAIPEVWGYMKPGENHFRDTGRLKYNRGDKSGKDMTCCIIM
ncbi:HHR222Wp [Eremothecium sinecaudum]|uniref:Guanine nucleotide-binding protein subunit gamma n=1 Tax=Eremothecium sinecaudum TaxID=45286 RepID=A0A0X8HWH3_9SACH|nr:HHR222Wp [Eremothecium sinecaudum]AMD22991.1 HHR222Wp [Eremothecium sinecaudum]